MSGEVGVGDTQKAVVDRAGLGIEAERARRFEAQLSVILINVDGLGMVNQRLGQEGGDRLLSELGHVIRENTRRIDVFGRWDTEDFIILTVDRNLYGSVALSEKLRRIINDRTFTLDDQEFRVSVSIGVARGIPKGPDGIDKLLQAASKAVMRAKVEGRNRVEFASDEHMCTPAQMPAIEKESDQ